MEFKCYNGDGVPIKLKLTSDTGKFDDADLRDGIAEKVKLNGDPSKITIYKLDATNNHKTGDPIIDCDDLVSTYDTKLFAYDLPSSGVSSHDTSLNGSDDSKGDRLMKRIRPDASTQNASFYEFVELKGLYEAIIAAQLVKLNAVQELTLDNFSWLTHTKDNKVSTVYVREAYHKLWSVVKVAHSVDEKAQNTTRSDVLIIGNPGIGKSWSLNYLLYMALKEELTSLVILRARGAWYCFFEGKCHEYQNFPGEVWVNNRLKDNERGLLLHDIGVAADKNDIGLDHNLSYGRLCIVLASSPKKGNYAGFERGRKPIKFYCPMLNKEEFLSIHPAAENEFTKFGGCLRDVGDAKTRQKLLDSRISSFNFGRTTLNEVNEDDPHAIVQVVPEGNNSEDYHLEFVSKYIEEEFFKTRWMALKDSIIANLYNKLNDSSVRELYGKPFESYVQEFPHKLLFDSVTNVDGTATSLMHFKPPKKDFCLVAKDNKELQTHVSTCLSAKVGKNRWIRPEIPNFPVLDALVVVNKKIYGVQITISDSHQPTTSTLNSLLKAGVSFGNHAPKKPIHIDGVLFVVDQYRNPTMNRVRVVPKPKDYTAGTDPVADAWETIPQFRLLVSCQEYLM